MKLTISNHVTLTAYAGTIVSDAMTWLIPTPTTAYPELPDAPLPIPVDIPGDITWVVKDTTVIIHYNVWQTWSARTSVGWGWINIEVRSSARRRTVEERDPSRAIALLHPWVDWALDCLTTWAHAASRPEGLDDADGLHLAVQIAQARRRGACFAPVIFNRDGITLHGQRVDAMTTEEALAIAASPPHLAQELGLPATQIASALTAASLA